MAPSSPLLMSNLYLKTGEVGGTMDLVLTEEISGSKLSFSQISKFVLELSNRYLDPYLLKVLQSLDFAILVF